MLLKKNWKERIGWDYTFIGTTSSLRLKGRDDNNLKTKDSLYQIKKRWLTWIENTGNPLDKELDNKNKLEIDRPIKKLKIATTLKAHKWNLDGWPFFPTFVRKLIWMYLSRRFGEQQMQFPPHLLHNSANYDRIWTWNFGLANPSIYFPHVICQIWSRICQTHGFSFFIPDLFSFCQTDGKWLCKLLGRPKSLPNMPILAY